MQNWKTILLSLNEGDFHRTMNLGLEDLSFSVTDTYVESNNMTFISIDEFICNAFTCLFEEYGLEDIAAYGSTEWEGDGRYYVVIKIVPENENPLLFEMIVKYDTFADLIHNVLRKIRHALENPVLDTVRVNLEQVVHLRDIAGEDVDPEVVKEVQEFLSGAEAPKRIVALAYNEIRRIQK